MTSDAATQERVYRAIKATLVRGEFAAGARLEISSLAKRYGASQTPVREVLGRLVGEGLVEHREEGGYRFCLLDAERLRDLYFWNAQHLLAALHVVREPVVVRALEPLRTRTAAAPIDQVALIAQIFQAIGDATGNAEFSERIRNANERLQGFRMAEIELFADTTLETSRLLALGRFNVQKNVRRKIMYYHRRRIEHAAQIIAAITS
ncbi:GntR family transcriptional regulator [Sphingomonas panacis]|uniref:GntR family transcriptional regulator n=1 Tax=Sphingomonas panacis TaxID=1560345 RepID=UPI0014714888|nr:GntR family transcriptional regulator [Sphingomonas panacis]